MVLLFGSGLPPYTTVQFLGSIIIDSAGNTVHGCIIGTNWEGLDGLGNYYGIRINGTHTQIGGPLPEHRNIISGNNMNTFDSSGIVMYNASFSHIQGNYIGTDSSGTRSIPNNYGIRIAGYDVLIGGDSGSNEGNLISGNHRGVSVGGTGNSVCGNVIGLNYDQSDAIANMWGISCGGIRNFIGVPLTGMGNIVCGNEQACIQVSGMGSIFQNNLVGLSAAGISFGGYTGFSIYHIASGNIIGSTTGNLLLEKNIISGLYWGIGFYQDAKNNTIVGNYFGTGLNGSGVVPNTHAHIKFDDNTSDNIIGDRNTFLGNLMVGGAIGIDLLSVNSSRNQFASNTICAFSNQGIVLRNGANENKIAPIITSASMSQVAGTSDPFDIVELFLAEPRADSYGGSLKTIGLTTADGIGNWSVIPAGLIYGDYVTATGTNTSNSTSQFSLNHFVTGSTATPTITFTVTPTPSITLTSTISPTRTISATFTISPTCTPTPTITPTSALAGIFLGDKVVLLYPNPFADQAQFLIHLDNAAEVKIIIYNMVGEKIAELLENLPVGHGQIIIWDCSQVATGIYIARVFIQGREVQKLKLALTRNK